MKKFMIFALAATFAASAFAQNPDALKQVKKAKTFNDAQTIIKANESSMSAAENAQAYNKCVDILMGDITAANTKFQMGQEAEVNKPVFYDQLYNAIASAIACDKYDIQPNDKGKVAPKFRKANADRLYSLRLHLINAGQEAYQAQNYAEAVKFLGIYTESGIVEMFQDAAAAADKQAKDQAKLMAKAEGKTVEEAVAEAEGDPYLWDVCRMASNSAFMAKDSRGAFKYAELLASNPDKEDEAVGYMRYFVQAEAPQTQQDSLNVLGQLKRLYDKYPSNADLFADVASWYGYMGATDKQDELIDKELQRDPQSFAALALRGQNFMYKAKYDEAIEYFKKAIAAKEDNASIYDCIGTCYNNKAAENPDAEESVTRGHIENAIKYYELARKYDPNQEKCRWAYKLYSCYYALYGENDSRTQEMKALTGM